MPRGQHANSRANLAGAAGGDRYAGKRLIIAAIEEALRTLENGREIREFFGLGPARVLKQKHRDRWAEVKAPQVYDAIVGGLSDSIVKVGFDSSMIEQLLEGYRQELMDEYSEDIDAGIITMEEALEEIEAEIESYRRWLLQQEPVKDFGVLDVDKFMRARAVYQEAKYPVKVYRSGLMVPIGEHQLTYMWAYFMGAEEGFGEYLPTVKRSEVGYGLGWGAVTWHYYPSVPAGVLPQRGVLHQIAAIKMKCGINIRMFFEDSEQVENRIVNLAPSYVWAYIIDEYSNYWVPFNELSESVPVARYCANWQEAQQIADAWGGVVPFYYDALGTDDFDAAMAVKLDGWNYEFESFGERRGGDPDRIAQFFPRRQRVSGEVDPVSGQMVYSDVKWLSADEWNANFRNSRGQWLAAGAIVPPEVAAPRKRALSVTFHPDFIAGIQADPPAGGAPV